MFHAVSVAYYVILHALTPLLEVPLIIQCYVYKETVTIEQLEVHASINIFIFRA